MHIICLTSDSFGAMELGYVCKQLASVSRCIIDDYRSFYSFIQVLSIYCVHRPTLDPLKHTVKHKTFATPAYNLNYIIDLVYL